MKAKDIAAKIIAGRSTANEGLAVDCLIEIVNEAITLAHSRKQDASKYAALREGFQKWRSVVAQVTAAAPEVLITDGLFLRAVYLDNPVWFAQCVRENVFLGHQLSAEEQAQLQTSKKALAKAEAAERDRMLAAEDARFERAFNLPAGYIKARRDNEREIQDAVNLFAAALMVSRGLRDDARAAWAA